MDSPMPRPVPAPRRPLILALVVIVVACPVLASLPGCAPVGPVRPSHSSAPGSAVQALAAKLAGLDFGSSLEVSWRELSLRDAEAIISCGLERPMGIDGAALADISDDYTFETLLLYSEVLEALRGYDRGSLSPGERVSYDIYQWHLPDQVCRGEFLHHDYLATFIHASSVHEQTLYFFTHLHPLGDRRDAENYVARLRQRRGEVRPAS